MNIQLKSNGLKPTKIALILSAILSTASSPAFSSQDSYVIDQSTASDNRTINVPSGSDISYIDVSVDDGLVIVDDNTSVTSIGTYPDDTLVSYEGYFIKSTAGLVDLGNHFTLNYDYDEGQNHNSGGVATLLEGTGKLAAENLSIDANGTRAITLYNQSRADLKGITTIENGSLETFQDSTINAENLNMVYSIPGSSAGSGRDGFLNLQGKTSNFSGDVNIQVQMTVDYNSYLKAIYIQNNTAQFAGKTNINLDVAEGEATGVELLDSDRQLGGGAHWDEYFYNNDVSFNDLAIKAHSHSDAGTQSHARGIYSRSVSGNTDLSINNLSVDVSGSDSALGIGLHDEGALGSAKYRINNAYITVSGGDSSWLKGYQSTRFDSASTDTVINNINIQSHGGREAALIEQMGSNDYFTGDITLGSQDSYESVADKLYSIYGFNTGERGSTNIVDNNRLVAWGEMYAGDNHTINIISGDNSYIYGDTVIEDSGAILMTLNGTNSRWDMVGDSTVTNLMLNGSTLNFMPGSTQNSNLSRNYVSFKTLRVTGDYHGSDSNIVMNTQLGDDNSPTDRLIVDGNTSGTTNVKVVNVGGGGGYTINGIELITVGGNSDGEFRQDGRIVAGAYDYTLQRGEDQKANNWYLSNKLPLQSEPQPAPEPQTPGTPPIPKPVPREYAVRPGAGLYGLNLQAANTLFNTRLHDRLGETHYVDALTGEQAVTSMWLRNVGGHTRQHDNSGQLAMQANRYVMQLGGDIAQWSSDNTDRYHLGLMAGYANQKARAENQRNGNRADSRISGYSVGLYGTWLQDNETHEGAYVDTWAQYSWFNNSVTDRNAESEEYDSRGLTASVESGYTWKLGDLSERNALYIQPKAQVTWMGVKENEHREDNGTRVEGRGDGNIQTRVGVRLSGKGHNKLDDGKGRTFQPFVEVNWLHNTRDFGVSMDGENVELAGSRNTGELKAGVEGQLTKNVAVWGNVAHQAGDKGYSDTSAMLGIKASF